MSAFLALIEQYKEKESYIPVEYYTQTGRTLAGVILKAVNGIVVVKLVDQDWMANVKINVNGIAGAAIPEEWCLTKEALMQYKELLPKDTPDSKQRGLLMLMEIFGDVAKAADDVTFHYVDAWPGVIDPRHEYAGFVSFNLNKSGEPLAGFIVDRTGKAEWVNNVSGEMQLTFMERP